MRVGFTGLATMANIKDFKNWGNIWYEIGWGIAIAHNLSPEDVKIEGSIIIELVVVAAIATTASRIIISALKVAEKVLDIRKKAEEIRGLKLKNEQLANDIEKEAEEEKKSGIEEVTANAVKQLKLKKEGEGDKVKALDTAVKDLVSFIEKGGVIDFVLPKNEEKPEEGTEREYDDLRIAFQEIRRIENKLAWLEHKDSQ